MKKSLAFLVVLAVTIACGPKKEKKKDKFQYKRTQVEDKNDLIDDNQNQIKIILNSYDNMIYDKTSIEVKYGNKITLTLNHKGKIGKEFMGHNFVLLKIGTDVDDFAKRAVKSKNTDYIPGGEDTIAYTKMIGGGESTTINFKAPEPGEYEYICSFPGHYNLMRGKLIVVK
jgi:azurin